MESDSRLKPLWKYLEYGVRLHLDDFSHVTGVVLLIFLPVAAVLYYFNPPLGTLMAGKTRLMEFLPWLLATQVLMRILQTFLFTLLLLNIHAQRSGGESVWDIAEALNRLWRVAAVDIVYVFGLQAAAVLALMFALVVSRIFFGGAGLGRLLAIALAGLLILGPAVRYYFCTFVALFRGPGFRDSFREAGAISAGGEVLIGSVVVAYMLVWFLVWQISLGLFGTSPFGQILAQSLIMVTSISYFFATYRLYFDLCLEAADRAAALEEEVFPPPPPAGGESPGGEEDEDRSRGDPPGGA